jgi:peptidyl-prolyl cis-trans isomerase C
MLKGMSLPGFAVFLPGCRNKRITRQSHFTTLFQGMPRYQNRDHVSQRGILMKVFPNHLAIVFAALLSTLTGCSPANTVSGTEAKPGTANSAVVSDEIIEVIIAEQRAQGAPDDPNMKENIRKQLTHRALLEQDAIKAGINKRPATMARQALAQQGALIQDYVMDWMKNNAPTDDELKQEYEKIKASLGEQKEYRVRHILLKTEQEAKATIAKLNKGAKFADLARKSLDPGSKDNGGDLDWINPTRFAQPFSEAMTKLSKGKYTTAPVKTIYGFHVILLEDVRNIQPPSFEEVKPELQQQMQQAKWQAHVEQLEKDANLK